MNRLLQFAILLALWYLMPVASATEPLHDQLVIDSKAGQIFPEKCCWLELPDSEELRSARRAESCSAIGGPVGQFKLLDDKIWLTGLYRCGGGIPLKSIFPNLPDPALADWLSGTFTARIDYLCRNQVGAPIYKREINLVIQRGVVRSRGEKINDESLCAPRHNLSLQPTRASYAGLVG
ncbi:hypothetical protein I7X39_22935 [Inhella sp. 1Y17]|uniref:Uncharacterized protein n=2 Tax=Inhella proteolytica TaxID=2795029 RepID=A0A931NK94_9BURK|nr:hypothetical protein [Inhella proteolytica]